MPNQTTAVPFSALQEQWYQRACSKLDPARLQRLLVDLVNIHSPTGGERAASEFMTRYMAETVGLEARYQPISALTGNAVGELRGSGGGANLLLYAPIDTHLDGDAAHDLPWAGRTLRDDMRPEARIDGDMVIGLGASNPKAMVACLTEITHAVRQAELPLLGDLTLSFAGGGMQAAENDAGYTSA